MALPRLAIQKRRNRKLVQRAGVGMSGLPAVNFHGASAREGARKIYECGVVHEFDFVAGESLSSRFRLGFGLNDC